MTALTSDPSSALLREGAINRTPTKALCRRGVIYHALTGKHGSRSPSQTVFLTLENTILDVIP
jgi:hypothetical protein